MRRLPAFAYLFAVLAVVAGMAVTATPVAAASPVAVDDTHTLLMNLPLIWGGSGVLGNDSDPDGDPIALVLDTAPSHAAAFSVSHTGSFQYTPIHDFTGTDTFTYHANDGFNDSNVATVTINVVEQPVGVADAYVVSKNVTLTTLPIEGVPANDTNAIGTAVELETNVAHGTLTLSANGSFSYSPAHDFVGTDGFDYSACVPQSVICTASTHVTLDVENAAPVVSGDAYETSGFGALHVAAPGFLANDSDPNGDPMTIQLTGVPSGPLNGYLALQADGSFTYTPNAGYVGPDSISYEACDPDGACSGGWVSITVPFGVHRNLAATAPAGAATSPTLAGWPAHGSVVIQANGSFTYTPYEGYVGTDVFSPGICMPFPGMGCMPMPTQTIHINVVNDAPVAAADTITTDEGMAVAADAPGVLANDSDLNEDALTATVVAPPAHGTLTLEPTGAYTYTPAAGFHGSDSFTYDACDDKTCSADATVTITVAAANRPPVFAAGVDGATWTVTPGSLPPTVVATDPEGETVTFEVVGGSLPDGLMLHTDGTWAGSTIGIVGEHALTIRACDSHEACVTADLTLDFGSDDASPSPTTSASPTASPTASPIVSPTASPIVSPTASASTSPTASASASPTASVEPTATASGTASGTAHITPPPTSGGGSGRSGDSPDGLVVVLLAGLLAVACSLAIAARSRGRSTH